MQFVSLAEKENEREWNLNGAFVAAILYGLLRLLPDIIDLQFDQLRLATHFINRQQKELVEKPLNTVNIVYCNIYIHFTYLLPTEY